MREKLPKWVGENYLNGGCTAGQLRLLWVRSLVTLAAFQTAVRDGLKIRPGGTLTRQPGSRLRFRHKGRQICQFEALKSNLLGGWEP